MLIGELAKKSGVTKDTIRHYEELGLISSKSRQAGSRVYREYGEDTLERLQRIAEGKALLFTLREIKPLLDLFMMKKLPKQKRITLLTEKLEEVDEKIRMAKSIKRKIEQKIRQVESE